MKIFRLYGTSACHLCEVAEAMITAQLAGIESVEVECVDISSTDALFQRYGLVIPVLQHADGRELCWPFAAQQLDAFLRS